MTNKIRAYRNWEEEANDSFSEWFWIQIVGKAVVVGLAISVPMFGFGAITAAEGVSRWENGANAVEVGHTFLWEHAGNAAIAGASFVADIMDNDSTETN